ncbi:hypothetical protein H7169_01295 [Candidatus Gracilibacteria bacterium]|nr:hypothetical protein [Candidatus Gracilibacteria bacterium]
MKIKILIILISILAIFTVVERQSLLVNSSLIMANMTHDMGQYSGGPTWVTRYNEAIWLSDKGRYAEAKSLIAPLLNDSSIDHQPQISELYGDILYYASGSLDDVIRIYERSLSYAPSNRVMTKIEYIKQIRSQKVGSGNTANTSTQSGNVDSGSIERDAKRAELQQISGKRAGYLDNSGLSSDGVRGELQRLIEYAQSGSSTITQDW